MKRFISVIITLLLIFIMMLCPTLTAFVFIGIIIYCLSDMIYDCMR